MRLRSAARTNVLEEAVVENPKVSQPRSWKLAGITHRSCFTSLYLFPLNSSISSPHFYHTIPISGQSRA